jgi:acetolactate synthase-1/2/3 large subunit
VIHLDIVAEEMGRTYEPTVKLWGDAKAGLEELHALADRAAEQKRAAPTTLPTSPSGWRPGATRRLKSG